MNVKRIYNDGTFICNFSVVLLILFLEGEAHSPLDLELKK